MTEVAGEGDELVRGLVAAVGGQGHGEAGDGFGLGEQASAPRHPSWMRIPTLVLQAAPWRDSRVRPVEGDGVVVKDSAGGLLSQGVEHDVQVAVGERSGCPWARKVGAEEQRVGIGAP